MSVKTYLEDEIMDEFEELKKMEVGTDMYKATIDGLTKLIDRSNNITKNESERDDRIEDRKIRIKEYEMKEAQLDEDRKSRKIQNCIAIGSIVVPAALTVWGTIKSLKFETDGIVTTIMGKGFINKLLPKK